MTEGRLFQVQLLDDRKLELLVQPKLLSYELLDLVSSHFNLKEKEFFGLAFFDDNGQCKWLQMDRRVLEHDFSKKPGVVSLNFLVRFYVENIAQLKDIITVELFFLNAKSLVFNETIEVESEHVFKLAAFALQEAKGEYTSAEAARSDLKSLPVLPTRVLREHPSLSYCEDKVIERYRKLKGLTRGQAIVQYLALVKSLPTYGVHYYPVKDKQGLPWWLGVSYKGIGQYDLQDKVKPRKLFQWKQLENLYFREKKFAVEVNDPHRRKVTKRTFGQAGLVIHSWYASHSLIKTIWAMAISQHQFYLDTKQSKANMTTTRSSGEIAVDLTEITVPQISKLIESKDPLIMASNGSLISTGSADSEVTEEQKKEKIAELKKKEKDLQDKLTQKLEELKKICLREAELTGELPKEYPIAPGEKAPPVRRRVGTAFKLDDMFPYDEDPHLRNLESRFALQQKIVEAANKLTNEADLNKTVKRKRKDNLKDALRKLEQIELEINAYRKTKGQKPTQRASLILADDALTSDISSLTDSLNLDDEEELGSQRQRSRSVQYSPRPHHADTLDIHYSGERRASAHDQLGDVRFSCNQVHESARYSRTQAVTSCSGLAKPASRQPHEARSMPATPVLTRSAYSSTQLRSEDAPQHFRQRSGSLESQAQVAVETKAPSIPTFTISTARRSNSTDILDDGSSYTSQSSVEYSAPVNHPHRRRAHGCHRKDLYANTGSMPNLAQQDARMPCYAYPPRTRPTTTAYYVTGYPNYLEPEPHTNRAYVYENEVEGHYSVNPSYHHTQAAYHNYDMHSPYGTDEMDGVPHNLYATMRPPRNRPVPRSSEQVGRNSQKALVAQHLKVWYERNTAHRHVDYDYDRAPQHSVSHRFMAAPHPQNYRTISYSSMSTASHSGNWHTQMSGRGMLEYDMPMHEPQPYSYNTAPCSLSTHSRSYVDVNHSSVDPEEHIHWHEDSKPGTIV
uniref:FERM domain containing 4B n=1 Tax=Nothobranchius korthausae TaxID=1143690 RepID=A0A1A8HA44_9TELE